MSRPGAEHTRYMTENDRKKILGTSIGKRDQESATVFGSEEHIEQMLLDARVDYALNHPDDIQAAVDESTKIADTNKKIVTGFLTTFNRAADTLRKAFPSMSPNKRAAVFTFLSAIFSVSAMQADARTPDPMDKNDLLNRTASVVAPAFSDEQRGAIDMDFRRSGSGGGFEVDVPRTKPPEEEGGENEDTSSGSGEPPKGDVPKPNGDQPREASKNGGKAPNQGGTEGTPSPVGVAASAPSGGTETFTPVPTSSATPTPTLEGSTAGSGIPMELTIVAGEAVPVTVEAIQTTTEYLGTFTEGKKKAYANTFGGLLAEKLQERIDQGFVWVWDEAAGAIEVFKPGQDATGEKTYLIAPLETVSRSQQALIDSLQPGGVHETFKLVGWNSIYNAFEVAPEDVTPEEAGYTYILVEKMGTEKIDNLYNESDIKMGVVRISKESGIMADGLWVQGIAKDHPSFSEFTFSPGLPEELRQAEYQTIRQLLLEKYGIPLDAQVQFFATAPNEGSTQYEGDLINDFASDLSVTKDANGKIIRVTIRLATSPQKFDSKTAERSGLGWNALARLFTECEVYFNNQTFNKALSATNDIMNKEYYPRINSDVIKVWDAEMAANNVTTNVTFFADKQEN